MNGGATSRDKLEKIARESLKGGKSYPATINLTSDYFDGQINLSGTELNIIFTPYEFTWFTFNSSIKESIVNRFQLFFQGELAPGRYPLSDDSNSVAWINMNVLFPRDNGPEPVFFKSGDVILDVFDRKSGQVRGRLEKVVVDIKMGPPITFSGDFRNK